MARYVYDKNKGEFVRSRPGVMEVLLKVIRYTLAILFSAAVFYVVFALFYSTDRERQLEREHSLLADEYADLSQQLDLVEGTVGNLRVRDREIYNNLFSADPPNYITEARDTLLSAVDELEALPETDLIWDAYALTSRMESTASQVSRWLTEIDTLLSGGSVAATAIPSMVPLAQFSPMQAGASVGKKINPFYKNIREHTGIDLVAPVGTPVRCTADGKVTDVVRSEKGMGNQVTVSHKGGLETVYAHLDAVRVSVGQNLRQGAAIGTVGQTGSCFAPCLHYEVRRGDFVQDPVNYFFAELDPATYRDMMIVALTTGQSMD
jgi:murein DD-endopeptidase MepM/ murein hydrolase activator NlpD